MNDLVSILIPAYKPQFFEASLLSAINQTYSKTEIIISDDCPTNRIEKIVTRYSLNNPKIKYKRNKPPEGGLLNYIKCFNLSNGNYIKFLNDDDILDNNCVERMVGCLTADIEKKIGAVACRRGVIDKNSNSLKDSFATIPLHSKNCIINGRDLIQLLLFSGQNLVGEPSAILFRKEDLSEVYPHFLSLKGIIAPGLGDIILLINLLSKKDLYYISEKLCFLRKHKLQRQNDEFIRKSIRKSLSDLRKQATKLNLFKNNCKFKYKYKLINEFKERYRFLSSNHIYLICKKFIEKIIIKFF